MESKRVGFRSLGIRANQLLNRYPQLTGVVLAILGASFFSSKAVVVKLAYRTAPIDPVALIMLRMLFALPFYLYIMVREHIKGQVIGTKNYLLIILLGFLGYYLSSFLDFYGLQYITASLERLILFIYPTFVVLIGALFLKQPFQRPHIFALTLTYLGLAIAYGGKIQLGLQPELVKGSLLVGACSVTFALFMVGSGYVIPKVGAARFTALAMIFSTLAVWCHFLVISNTGEVRLWGYPNMVYVHALTMAIFCTVIPSLLTAKAILMLGASQVSIIGSLGPIITIILSFIFLSETLDIYQAIGTVLVILGVTTVSKRKRMR